jgi:chorismate lyase/3-hydroxybenzoate synthase
LGNQSSRRIVAAPAALPQLTPEPPAWVSRLIPDPPAADVTAGRGVSGIETSTRGDLLRARVQLPGARRVDPDALTSAVRDAYLALAAHLREAGRHPIRIWNFVPGIGDRFGALDRYMVFNRGRFEAFDRLGTTRLPTSSGVGVDSDDLVIDVLAAAAPGTPIENPRQIPSWKYSSVYGPRPPCFARATIAELGQRRWLLIGGTASIVGEDSCHPEHLEAQLEETFANLCALIESVTPRRADPLSLVEDARVYVARASDASAVVEAVRRRFEAAREIELAIATVCRPELLVEIEARVCLTPRPA